MLSFSAKFAHDLIEFAGRQGAEVRPLYAAAGLSAAQLLREDVRVPASVMAYIWKTAIDASSEPYLALKLGLNQYSAQQTPSLIMSTSATVGEAFGQAIRYGQLIANVMDVSMQPEGALLALRFELQPAWQREDRRVTLDCLLIAMMSASRSIGSLTGVPQPPERVSLQAAHLPDRGFVYRCFDCPIELDQPCNAVYFRESVLKQEVVQPNPGLRAAIQAYADDIYAQLAPAGSLCDRVRRTLTRALPARPGQRQVARELNMSVRTLQRKLDREGASYRQLVEQVHVQCAHHHLSTGKRPLEEVAYLAGYSDASSLLRAYKRHYKTLPGRVKG